MSESAASSSPRRDLGQPRRGHGLYRALTERSGGPLPPARAASRLSAYVYGNILVLAAIVASSPDSIDTGHAALLVVGTGVTTYIAHVFAELIAHANIPEAHPETLPETHHETLSDAADEARLVARAGVGELRDAVPIASSAVWPAIVLAMAWLDWLPSAAAQLVAGAVVVLRIASIAPVVQRVRGNPLSLGMLIAGLATAALAAVIVLLKTVVGY